MLVRSIDTEIAILHVIHVTIHVKVHKVHQHLTHVHQDIVYQDQHVVQQPRQLQVLITLARQGGRIVEDFVGGQYRLLLQVQQHTHVHQVGRDQDQLVLDHSRRQGTIHVRRAVRYQVQLVTKQRVIILGIHMPVHLVIQIRDQTVEEVILLLGSITVVEQDVQEVVELVIVVKVHHQVLRTLVHQHIHCQEQLVMNFKLQLRQQRIVVRRVVIYQDQIVTVQLQHLRQPTTHVHQDGVGRALLVISPIVAILTHVTVPHIGELGVVGVQLS